MYSHHVHFKNAFMTVAQSDPHKILSYDRMHNDSNEIDGTENLNISYQLYLNISKHLGPKCWLSSIKGLFLSSVLFYNWIIFFSIRFKDMPSWCGLTHFDQVVSIDFTDATKLENLSL